jgi:serine protease Do
MKNNKYVLSLALMSTAFTGVLVGALVVNKPALDPGSSYAATNKVPAVIERSEQSLSKSGVADKLSKDFITISRDVTPAIVTIYSTKITKNKPQYHEFMDDPLFRRFFGTPRNNPNDPGTEQPEEGSKQEGLGSGVIIDKDGIIVTNNHVIEGADDISVTLYDKRKYKAKVLGADPKTDVAVIKLDKTKDLPVAKLGDSSRIEVGEWVLAIGNPLGLSSTVTSGIISAKGRADVGVADFEDFIQTDAAINPGNSGGALVNLQGEVIGINTAIASRTGGYMGIGFAIPSNMVKKVMNDLITKGKVVRGFLGIQIQNMNESMAKGLRLDDPNKGIFVGEVVPRSPAAKAGLLPYDVIMELNGRPVTDVNSFRNEIASTDPGQTAKLMVIRDGKKISLDIKLAELDNAVASVKQEPGNVEKPETKLGLEVEPLTPDIMTELGIDKGTKGVIITNVNNTGNAGDAGIMRGDIVQEMNRQKILSVEDFNRVSKTVKSGDAVILKLLRGKQNLVLAFTHQ